MKKNILFGALTLFLTSCASSEPIELMSKNSIAFDVHLGKISRAGDVTTSNFQNFFVYGGYDENNLVFNGDEVVKKDGIWSPTTIKYWEDGKIYKFAAIAPENVNASFDLNEFLIKDYTPEDNDLVIALSAPVEAHTFTNSVPLNFKHALSKIQISFKSEQTTEISYEISDIVLSNVLTKGTLKSAFENGTNISWDNSSEVGSYIYNLKDDETGVKYLLPQLLGETSAISFKVYALLKDGSSLEENFSVNIKTENVDKWETGHAYNYLIDLNSTLNLHEITFTVEDIHGWEGEDTPNEPEPTPEERDPLADGKLCILAIGNSFSQDAVEQYLYEICEAAGIEAVIGNLYIGGCRLDTHWSNAQSGNGAYEYRKVVNGVKTESKNVSLPYGIADEDWDFITLQQASGSSGVYSTYTPYLQNLIDWVSNRSEAEIWFHQTWAYAKDSDHAEFPKYDKDQMTMYQAIMESVSQAMSEHPQLKGVIPSGTAIQNGRTTFLGDSFNRDGYHLETTYGRYTAACTWFEALTGINVVGNNYAPSTINAQQKAIAQNAAHLAILKPFEVTEMADFAKPDVSGPLTSSLFIDFGGNKGDNSWNFINETDASDIILTDAEGNYTSVTLTIESPFTSSFNGAGSEPQEDNVIISGGISWPLKTWADSFVISGPVGADSDEASIVLSGLDASKTYDVIVLSARWNGSRNARQTKFELVSNGKTETAQIYQGIGRTDFNWDTFNFDDISHTFASVVPTADGKIELKVSGLEVGSTVVEGNISGLCVIPN